MLFEIAQSIEAYLPAKARQQQEAGPPINIEIPTLTSQHQEQADKAARIEKMRMEIPAALNFPVLIAQLPYIVPLRREWVPLGMLREEWRVVSWPLAGIFFWWLAGRGADALRAIRTSVVAPRITISETIFAGLMFALGVVTLVAILTSTPDDRLDIYFLGLLAGGLLWGVLGAFTIAARFLQWRIAKRAAVPALT